MFTPPVEVVGEGVVWDPRDFGEEVGVVWPDEGEPCCCCLLTRGLSSDPARARTDA